MRASIAAALCLPLPLVLAGCTLTTTAVPSPVQVAELRGVVHGGQQPIAGAHVYLLATNKTGYGGPGIAPSASNASVSLLDPALTGHSDSLGGYVLTNAHGEFTLTNGFSCVSQQEIYLYTSGGDPGAGTNPAATLMAAIGECPANGIYTFAVFLNINEATTVAAAYGLAGFASDPTHISDSGTDQAFSGMVGAFVAASELVDVSTGAAGTTTIYGYGTPPQQEINTLANILAACINSDGAVSGPSNPTACYTLFTSATSDGTPTGTQPTDTATAAINIAHNPGANVQALYNLPTAQAPFAPVLSSVPNDWTVGIVYSGDGVVDPQAIAVDSGDGIWTANNGNNTVQRIDGAGVPSGTASGYSAGTDSGFFSIAVDLSDNAWVPANSSNQLIQFSGSNGAATTYSGGGLNFPYAVAIDGSGNVWVTNQGSPNSVSEFSSTGTPPSSAYTGGNLGNPRSIAIDHSGNAWVANKNNGTVTELKSDGTILSGANGYNGGGLETPYSIAIDASGNPWIADAGSLTGSVVELEGASGAHPGQGMPLSPYTGGGIVNPDGIALDGAGNAWVADQTNGPAIVAEFAGNGNPISPSTGYTPPGVVSSTIAVAVDGSGNVWIADPSASSITKLVGAAVPVVTPLAAAVKNGTLASRP